MIDFKKHLKAFKELQKNKRQRQQDSGKTYDFDFVLTDELKKAVSLLENTNSHLFITGKAGTGKSTLIRYFRDTTNKNVAIVAPTGLSAINIGGQTIHSFFRLPPRIIDETCIKEVWNRDLYRNLDVIIIDEISMVRADILDGIDLFLRINGPSRSLPFGGIQMAFFGDMFQLPPVVNNEESHVFHDLYDTPYFFSSKVFKAADIRLLELQKVFRQKDDAFISILNKIRVGDTNEDVMTQINSRIFNRADREIYKANGAYTILTSTNRIAGDMNNRYLNRIEEPTFTYTAEIEGKFPTNNMALPVDLELNLKVGARVIFTKNDSSKPRQWVNGTIGKVEELDRNYVTVRIEDNGLQVCVQKETWQKLAYEYNRNTKSIGTKITGSLTQIPLRLAWALTIHKCVSGNGMILTKEYGTIPIKEMNVGIHVLSGDGRYRKCTRMSSTGKKKEFLVKTRSGYELLCSKEHPLLCVTEKNQEEHYLRTDKIKSGDYVCISRQKINNQSRSISFPYRYSWREKKINMPKTIDKDLSWLLGCLVGDGCYNYKDRIDITTEDKEIIVRVKRILKKIGLNAKVSKKKENKAICLYAHSQPFRRFLASIGLDYCTGKNKKIPKCIMESNLSNKLAFIGGLFDTDGSCGMKHGIRFVNISKPVMQSLQVLLLQCGVVSYLSESESAYCLHITGNAVRILHGNVEFTVKRKQKIFDRIVKKKGKTSNDFIPFADELKKSFKFAMNNIFEKSQGIKGRGIRSRNNPFINMLRSIFGSYKNFSFKNLHQLIDYCKLISAKIPERAHELLKNEYFYDKVVSVIPTGKRINMYDIEVDTDHSFVCNGFVCHNSQGMTFDRVYLDLTTSPFTHGQTYVALSRCRSFEGLLLSTALHASDIIVDKDILDFHRLVKSLRRVEVV